MVNGPVWDEQLTVNDWIDQTIAVYAAVFYLQRSSVKRCTSERFSPKFVLYRLS